jgi:predicted XRE-type DNA-binding protein
MNKAPNSGINETWEEGSTNVFADLDMPDAEEKLAKAELTFKINQIIKHKKLKQAQAAELLGVDQSKISLLSHGRLSDFSIERLMKYLILLDQDVEIIIKSKVTKKTEREHGQHGSLRVIYA